MAYVTTGIAGAQDTVVIILHDEDGPVEHLTSDEALELGLRLIATTSRRDARLDTVLAAAQTDILKAGRIGLDIVASTPLQGLVHGILQLGQYANDELSLPSGKEPPYKEHVAAISTLIARAILDRESLA